MITKGIIVGVPENTSDNKYQVRLPFFEDSTENAEEMIYDVTLSEAAGINQGYDLNEVVYCAFEDNDFGRPVIIGKLFIAGKENTGADISASTLEVSHKVILPTDTTIGDVTINQIKNMISYTMINGGGNVFVSYSDQYDDDQLAQYGW